MLGRDGARQSLDLNHNLRPYSPGDWCGAEVVAAAGGKGQVMACRGPAMLARNHAAPGGHGRCHQPACRPHFCGATVPVLLAARAVVCPERCGEQVAHRRCITYTRSITMLSRRERHTGMAWNRRALSVRLTHGLRSGLSCRCDGCGCAASSCTQDVNRRTGAVVSTLVFPFSAGQPTKQPHSPPPPRPPSSCCGTSGKAAQLRTVLHTAATLHTAVQLQLQERASRCGSRCHAAELAMDPYEARQCMFMQV